MKKYISLAILLELMDGKKHIAKAMAEKFETSVKTIYRSIEILLQAGVPLTSSSGRDGGYMLISNKNMDYSFLTTKEISSFLSFVNSNPSSVLSINPNDLEEKLIKIGKEKEVKNIKEDSQKLVIDTEIWGSQISNSNEINIVKECINLCQKIEIIYNTERRIIHPYTLVFKVGIWYVYAYCEKRKDFRLFKISKISNIQKLKQNYHRIDINIKNKPWNQDFNKNGELIKVTLSCRECYFGDITDWLGTTFKILNKNKDWIKIETDAILSTGLIHRLMQFSDRIKIHSPNLLQEELKNECYKIINNYKTISEVN